MYNGIINIYKEKGFTSHDVVAKMRGILKQKKIGHTGTLDPDAEGVLPVCLGSGTRLCDMLTDRDKEYEAVLFLGATTDTQDMSGQILQERPVTVSEEEIRKIILSFVGDYDQIPPMYSALKVDGKKLYELARQGREVERKARPVQIKKIEILSVELPRVTMRVECSKGTYIRTLCHDIGEKAGCGGAMEHLLRTRVGIFMLDQAIPLAKLEQYRDEDRISEVLVPVEDMFAHLSAVHVSPEFQKLLDNGNQFYVHQAMEQADYAEGQEVRVYSAEERFFGVYQYDAGEKRFKPKKMFMSQE